MQMDLGADMLVLPLLCLLASTYSLPGPGTVYAAPMQCSHAEASETCREVPDPEPDCPSHRVNLPACPYDYKQPGNSGTTSQNGGCAIQGRNDNAADVVNVNMSLTLVPRNVNEADITVSWEHLNLTISEGSMLELRLIDSGQRCLMPGYLFCSHRCFSTNDILQSSYTFTGVRYYSVNQVQLIVAMGSVATTIVRTTFAASPNDFNCTNTDIIPYAIEICRPERYGVVRNLQAEVIRGEETIALLSWLPPVQHELYHARLHYYLYVTAHSQPALTQYFNVSSTSTPAASNVSIGPLDPSLNYTIGVRPYADCSACGTLSDSIPLPISVSSVPEPSRVVLSSSVPPSVEYPISVTSTPVPSPVVPSPEDALQPDVFHGSLGGLGVVVLVLVTAMVTATLIYCAVKKQKRSTTMTAPPVLPPPVISYKHEDELATSYPYPPLSKNSGYTHMSQLIPGYPNHPSGSSEPEPTQAVEQLDYDFENMSQILEETASSGSEREASGGESPEVILGGYKVLVVYSRCRSEPVKSLETMRSIELVDTLKDYEGFSPTCLDLVSMRNQPCCWLEDTAQSADAILCVWTEQFRKDWDEGSFFTETLKTVIRVKKMKKEDSVALVFLKEDDEKYIPDMLLLHQHFGIHEIKKIAAFVKDAPPCVLKERRHTANGVTTHPTTHPRDLASPSELRQAFEPLPLS